MWKRSPYFVICLLAVSLTILSACSVTRTTRGNLAPGAQIEKGSKVLVMSVADPYEKHKDPAHGSGAAVVAAIRDALMAHGFRPLTSKIEDLKSATSEAVQSACRYVLKAVVTEWEDNLTPWSGKPDSYELSVEIYSVPEGDLLGAATHRAVAPEFAGFERNPDRFIPEAVDFTLGKIFGWEPTVFVNE
jgi:hypothetical protein